MVTITIGVVVPQSDAALRRSLADLEALRLPSSLVELLREVDMQWQQLQARIADANRRIQAHANADEACMRLRAIIGIGPITASALVASIGDAKNFDSGRQVAAWLGLVPRQHSSGGKSNLLGMSKRGDTYLRTLLIHGARSVIYRAGQRTESCQWINNVVNRRNKNVAAVALANKNARIVWALLAHDRHYQAGFVRAVATS